MPSSVVLVGALAALSMACETSLPPEAYRERKNTSDAASTATPGAPPPAAAPIPPPPRLAEHNTVFPPPEQMEQPADLPGSLVPSRGAKPATGPHVLSITQLRHGPRIDGLLIMFDQPMEVSEGALDPTPYMTITPKIAGQVEWRDEHALVWRPAAPLPPATHFDVSVSGGASLWGDALAEPKTTGFDTVGLSVESESGYASFDTPGRFDEEHGLVIAFNTPVSLAAVRAALQMEEADQQDHLISAPHTVEAEVEVAGKGTEAGAQSFGVKPKGGAVTDHWYRVRVRQGLVALDGLRLANDASLIARGKQSLRVLGFSCGYRCTAADPWIVSFSDIVDPQVVAGCLSVSPELAFDVRPDATTVTVTPHGPRVGKTYTLSASTACKTLDGRALATAASSSFTIDRPAPVLGMVEGIGFMAPVSAGTPSVTVRAGWTGPVHLALATLDHDAFIAALPIIAQDGGGFDLWSLGNKPDEAFSVIPPAEAEERIVSIPVPLTRRLNASRRGLVFVEASARPRSAYDSELRRNAVVAVTDLSLVAKRMPDETLVWVTSFTDDRPLAGVKVELYTRTGVQVWEGETDEDGVAHGPGVDSPDDASAGVILVASREADLAFLDLMGGSTRFEAHRFGVPAEWTAPEQELDGLVFTERGVYRSGETVHVKGYLRTAQDGVLARVDEPMTVTVTDPSGDVVATDNPDLGPASDFALDVPLADGARFGRYAIDVHPTSASGDDAPHLVGAFRVEAYRANNFEVKVEPPTLADGHLTAGVTGRYYYGASMAGAAASWWLHRHAETFAPKGFERFRFGTPGEFEERWQPAGTAADTVVEGQGALDAEGRLAVDAKLDAKAIGDRPYRFELEAEITDADDQVVAARASITSLPADVLPGLKVTPSFAARGEPIRADVAVVGRDGKASANQPVKLRWLQRTWTWARVRAAGGGLTWESQHEDKVVQEATLTSDAEGAANAELTPEDAGEYWLEATTTDAGGHVAVSRARIWVSGAGATWEAENDGTVRVTPDQPRYRVGDTARFIVQSPYARGMALATVEHAGILWQKRFAFSSTAPLIEIPVTDAMRPSAYVSVVIEGAEPTDASDTRTARRPSARVGVARLDLDNDDRRLRVAITPDQPRYLPHTPCARASS
ncbi:MAG: MG2 domain-containing protein [Myxococcota bacterium]